jgi:hypothetical protein
MATQIGMHARFGPFFRNGVLQTRAKLYTYAAATSTPLAAYMDHTLKVSATNPLVSNAQGLIAAYFRGRYKLVVKDDTDSAILASWDNVQLLDPQHNSVAGEAMRLGPDGELFDGEDTVPRHMRIVGRWSNPATPGVRAEGDRIVFYETDHWKTAIGMLLQNGIWMQGHGANGESVLEVWGGSDASAPVKRFFVTFDGRVKVPNTGKLHLPVVATANLPAAGADEDGSLLIEDNGTGDRNLILYAGGQRFRIDGGAAF